MGLGPNEIRSTMSELEVEMVEKWFFPRRGFRLEPAGLGDRVTNPPRSDRSVLGGTLGRPTIFLPWVRERVARGVPTCPGATCSERMEDDHRVPVIVYGIWDPVFRECLLAALHIEVQSGRRRVALCRPSGGPTTLPGRSVVHSRLEEEIFLFRFRADVGV